MTGWRWLAVIRGDVVTLVEHTVWTALCSGTDDPARVEGFETLTDDNWPDDETELLYRTAPMPGAWTATA